MILAVFVIAVALGTEAEFQFRVAFIRSTADGVDKRAFYKQQQERIAEFANKVHNGEITNAAGEKFTTVVQIGIGGSDLGPRAMYLALENWAKKRSREQER